MHKARFLTCTSRRVRDLCRTHPGRGSTPDEHERPGIAISCRAFTLIEVLVVAGVVSLLIAILVPSLARSRENARMVTCRSNLKQCGNAMLMYASRHKETLPFEERPDPRPGMGARGETEDADGDRVWDNLSDQRRGWICWYDVMDRDFGASQTDPAVKICPTVRRQDPYSEESYRMNSKLADCAKYRPAGGSQPNPYYMPYRRIPSLRRPTRTALLFDGDTGSGGEQESPPSFKGRWRLASLSGISDDVNYRHARSTNLLFVDWHIEGIHKNVMKDRSYENKNIVWQPSDMGRWNPAPK